jgi:MoxR-like ATPase
MQQPSSIGAVQELLDAQGYVCGRALGTVAFLGLRLGRPLFLEGEAVYEWNFAEQMVAIRTAEAMGFEGPGADRDALKDELFTEQYLIERPLLQAMRPQAGGAPVLLIDEIDRADEPFEAFLLEALSDFQVTVPELGTIRAPEPPIVILTSNRTREVHDALKRRCLYHWVDYPDFDREIEILQARAPEAADSLSREVVAFVQKLRTEDLFKKPGVAETIDWAKCLLALDVISLSPDVIADTLGAILKYQDDIARLQGSEAKRILDEAKASLVPA